MKKQSPTSNDDSLHDPPGYIEPSRQDLLLTDITAENLPEIAKSLDVEYLGAAQFPSQLPATGNIVGGNHRLMINLVCRRRSQKEVPAVNIVFLVDTGSPVSYLSQPALEALIGNCESMPRMLYVLVNNEHAVECHISPSGSHFEDVNVLGMDFISVNGLSLVMNWVSKTFVMQTVK
jgi:hypothetical protein